MALNKYGIEDAMWKMLPVEDQNQISTEYYAKIAAATNTAPAYVAPSVGGYSSSAVTDPEQVRQLESAYTPPASAQPAPSNPKWVFAVNLPSTYPDYAAMKAAGTGLVVVADDPNADTLINGARQWGIPVSIQVNAPPGITPQEYAARVAAAKARWNPDMLVLDIEDVGKGYQGSEGWDWSTQTAALLQPVIGGTSTAITMPPTQDDYNYAAYKGLGGDTQYWVQSYLGDMTAVDPNASRQTLIDNGVDPNSITVITGPTQAPPPSGMQWASWGIATNTTSAGVYGSVGSPAGTGTYIPGTSSTYGQTPGGQALAGAYGALPGTSTGTSFPNSGGTRIDPITYVNGVPVYSGTTSGTQPHDWASIYFSSLGLPPDVVKAVNDIFSKYSDINEATGVALAYIRGTPWYAQTFPGIQYGIQHGIIADERDYRQYVTSIDTYAQRYLGRHISGDEITGYLAQGISPAIVGQQYAGQANVQAFGGDYKYTLGAFGEGQPTPAELTALGQEQVGLDNPVGQRMQRALQQATQRLQTIFQGTAATPSLSTTGGLSAPSLLGQQSKPDVAA
jgi:hypothetical protein